MTPSTAPWTTLCPLPYFFSLSLPLCRTLGGPKGGYLLIDDVLIPRYRSGQLGLKRLRSPKDGAYLYGFSLVVLAWIDARGRRRVPLAFLPYFADGEESKLDLALSLLEWAREEGFEPEGVLFDAWYAAKEVLEWLHAQGWSFVTRLRANRLLEGIQLRRHGGAYWVKVGHLKGLSFAVQVVRRGRGFYASSGVDSEGKRTVEVYRLRQGIEEIFQGLQQELGWKGHRHWRRAKVLGHLALRRALARRSGLWAHRVSARAAKVEFLPMPTETDRR